MVDGTPNSGNRFVEVVKEVAQGLFLLLVGIAYLAGLCLAPLLILWFASFIESLGRTLHLGSFLALLIVVVPGIFTLGLAVLIGQKIVHRIRTISRILRACPHGIRGPRKDRCEKCATERRKKEEELLQFKTLQEARKRIKEQRDAVRNEEIARLSKAWVSHSDSYFSMSPRVFEDAIARVFFELGYEVKQTPYSNDGGKDAVLWKDGKKFVLECKRYARSCLTGRRDLQILLAAKHDVQADGAFFVTTGRFARTAVEYARLNQIQIYDGDHLPILLNKAFNSLASLPVVRVVCEACGDIVHFDVFKHEESEPKLCTAGHTVRCNVKLDELTVATSMEIPVCPDHRIPLRLVKTNWREFWGCPKYPKCQVRISVKKRMHSREGDVPLPKR